MELGKEDLVEELKSVLAKRYDSIEDFFDCDMKNLPDFSKLKDLRKSALRIKSAIDKGQKIAVFGDYDADGCTSCAVILGFFKLIQYENIICYQPSRFVEGYGIHESNVLKAKEDGVDVLITVDCGITGDLASKKARELGIDLIITDHHSDSSKELPTAFSVVNPKRRDQGEIGELTHLAGCGVAFVLCLEIKEVLEVEDSIAHLLEFVAIGTIGDRVLLCPMNLKFVRLGLHFLRESKHDALNYYFRDKDPRLLSSDDISFGLAPLINAKGRLGSPDLALKFLMAKEGEAKKILPELVENNLSRKGIQWRGLISALESIEAQDLKSDILVCYSPDLHEGVVGLIASRLVDLFSRPAIVLTDSTKAGVIKGSGRSIEGFSLHGALLTINEHFLTFGGHKMALGLSFQNSEFDSIKDKIAKISVSAKLEKSADIEIESFSSLTRDFFNFQRKMEPFGQGNPRPLFAIRGTVQSIKKMKDKHLKLSVVDESGNIRELLLFNYLLGEGLLSKVKRPDESELLNQSFLFHFSANLTSFRGRVSPSLIVDHLEP